MKNKPIIIIAMSILLLVSGCGIDGTTFNAEYENNCQQVCLNEGLQTGWVSESSTHYYCTCQKKMGFPK